MAANEQVFAVAGYSVLRHAGTEADCYFMVEDKISRLIKNIKLKLKLNKDLMLIAFPSSPAFANTFVVRSLLWSIVIILIFYAFN